MDNYNYPMGADNSDAPWNEKEIPKRKIEVTVSVTLSKTVEVEVDDYELKEEGVDEDGCFYEDIDYSQCNLKRAVEEQITLPQDACNGWDIDDFEVILE